MSGGNILAGLVFSGDLAAAADDDPAAAAAASASGTRAPGLKRMRPEGEGGGAAAAGPVGGDGGVQWRAAALKRAMAEAERSGVSLDAVVSERWGSVRELTGGADPAAFLRAADAAAKRLPKRGRGKGGRGRGA